MRTMAGIIPMHRLNRAESSVRAQACAEHFLQNEKEFQLGALPTEQSHPATKALSTVIAQDTRPGISLLQAVDRDIEAALPRVFSSPEWQLLTESFLHALRRKRKICFSGCGATGRVSILLEASYRGYRRRHPEANLPDIVCSIMTGGDYALVRSVESFEDYAAFGRRQVQDLGISEGDVLVAVSEGGETCSVIGTAWQALENGARVFFACNNPLDVLAAHVTRSQQVIHDSRIVKLDLSTGPMAIAGSTRLQATTIEILALGAALEIAIARFAGFDQPASATRYAEQFSILLSELGQSLQLGELARLVEIEEDVYSRQGAVTYLAQRALLDIFTDTTERAPTFSLPPFRNSDHAWAFRSWAFVKTPTLQSSEAWESVYQRRPRCLDWSSSDYRSMGASESLIKSPPAIGVADLKKFVIGNEDDPSRYQTRYDLGLLVLVANEPDLLCRDKAFADSFKACAERFPKKAGLSIGPRSLPRDVVEDRLHIACTLPGSVLRIWEHLAIKLVFNTVSTATMARMGRVAGNWMAHVETTNKKLIDRGSRLISELAGVAYDRACMELFIAREALSRWDSSNGEPPSPVALAIERLRAPVGKSLL